MTPEDARKLLGGYATGSLTEAERTALFEAALEDQELFDELAGEQVLMEVLDEPGARQRLIAVLAPPRHRAWLWVPAAATVAVAVVIGIVVSSRTPPPPQQIAQAVKSPEPVAPPAVRESAPAPAPVRRKVAPVPAPVPVPVPETAPPPAPPPPAELQKEEALTDRLQQAKPQAKAAGRGFVAGAPAAAGLRAENAVVSAPGGFAFSYAVRTDGFLEIVPATPGFLSVMTANNAVVFPNSSVSTGTPLRIPIPPDAASMTIVFSRMPGATGTPVRRDESSGTVTDQDPPNGRIMVELFLKPATQ